MINNNAIKALEYCKKVLIDELTKYVAGFKRKRKSVNIALTSEVNTTYDLELIPTVYIINELYIDDEGKLMVVYKEECDDSDDEDDDDCIENCNVGEIAHIIDEL